MVCLKLPVIEETAEAGMIVRRLWSLRRRYCPRPVLLLGVAICLFFQTLMVARSRFRCGSAAFVQRNNSSETSEDYFEEFLKYPERLVSVIEALQNNTHVDVAPQKGGGPPRRAVLLTGQHVATDTEVQLYQRVLQQHGYEVSVSTYAESSTMLRQDVRWPGSREWALLICLRGSEKSCLKKVHSYHLQPHQQINLMPGIVRAFSEVDGLCRFQSDSRLLGLEFPIVPTACGSSGHKPSCISSKDERSRRGFVAMVKVYVLITSLTPLTAFLHSSGLVRTNATVHSYATKLHAFFLRHLGPEASLQSLDNIKEAVGGVLLSAAMTSEDSSARTRCPLCYQLMTFALHFSCSLFPEIVKVQSELHFEDLKDPGFDGQIIKEFILEDVLNFLLPVHINHDKTLAPALLSGAVIGGKSGGCNGARGVCLPPDQGLFLLRFLRQLKMPGPFQLLYPSGSPGLSRLQRRLGRRFSAPAGSWNGIHLAALLNRLDSLQSQQSGNRSERMGDSEVPSGSFSHSPSQDSQSDGESLYRPDCSSGPRRCSEPYLRQLYTDPPLVLTPPFSPQVKEYRAEVPFDVVTLKIRAEPFSCHCQVHLDERRGPRTANYPVGLGNSRVSVLVVDEWGPEPVVVTIYALHLFRESRPSLPMFDEHVMCGFVQDCGLVVQPGLPCGLQPFVQTGDPGNPQASTQPCVSGDASGRWVVPCLSCSDNRTCDWREVSWQPDHCQHPRLDRPQLQICMENRKVLFIGDSTNRGMMYYFMERVNATLEAWDKAHDTIVYHNVNGGRTLISYSYYPQFWLEKPQRPTFQMALQQLIQRSRPLENSPQTVLVAGGVQWLNTNHLKILQQVLKREHLLNIQVVIKSLGMGFHLPVDGIRSLSLSDVQDLYSVNRNILTTAKLYGFQVIDTLSITMGRYREFLQGKCACHFHEVGKLPLSKVPVHRKMRLFRRGDESWTGVGPPLPLQDSRSRSDSLYHVRGSVNQVYSEILLSRMCYHDRGNLTTWSR